MMMGPGCRKGFGSIARDFERVELGSMVVADCRVMVVGRREVDLGQRSIVVDLAVGMEADS